MIILGGTVGLFIALVLLGLFYPGTGADQLNWRPTRTAEQEAQDEMDDLDQMLEAANRRRRARGQEELTEHSVRSSLAQEAQADENDEELLEEEVAQVLERRNAKRRARGEPEQTVAEYLAELRGGR